ncbi:DNA-binding protein WhiA [Leuconostocaceae bacterium ESL0958]|nr:DNA-binding protein WhiA [Leuconostocaceae bacterium ESL0958]
MSYAAEVKKELTGKIVSDEAAKSELAALLQMNGVVTLGTAFQELRVKTENPAIARRIFTLIRQSYPQQEVEVAVQQQPNINAKNNLVVVLHEGVAAVLDDLGVDPFGIDQTVPIRLINNSEKQQAFLRGAFLAAGSVNAPEKSNYHLEITTGHEGLAEQIAQLIMNFDLPVKMVARGGRYVLYLKRSDKIVELLKVIGATQMMLRFEDLRLVRDMRNSANRLVNADNANMQKVADAANNQVQAILTIQAEIGDLDLLPGKLADFAQTRLDHPSVSLTEIGAYLEISKSGANHRMRKLKALAEKIESGDEIDLDQL